MIHARPAREGFDTSKPGFASCALWPEERWTLDRLSDLSGHLPLGVTMTPYLTLYPCQRFYAVARTWPDPANDRAGCVLTHTLLLRGIPSVDGLRRALGALRCPATGLRDRVDYAGPVDLFAATPVPMEPLDPALRDALLRLSTRPRRVPGCLLFWDDPPHDAVALAVWSGLDPAGRATLTLCTGALGVRRDRFEHAFRVLVAPRGARASFPELHGEEVSASGTLASLERNR